MRRLIAAALALIIGTSAQAAVDIKTVTSPGGINAWLVEEPSIPFVSLEIRFRGGASLDPEGKRGVVNLMTGLIEEGAGDLSAQDWQSQREALAASFDFRAFDDTLSISAQFLTENKEEALALLREALINPRFDQDAIDRVRSQVLVGIASDEKDPNRIAGAFFDQAAFGDHPYGTSMDGTVESVNGLTRDDIVAAHQTALTR